MHMPGLEHGRTVLDARATGTAAGGNTVSRNGWKGGTRKVLRELGRSLRWQRDAIRDVLDARKVEAEVGDCWDRYFKRAGPLQPEELCLPTGLAGTGRSCA